MLQKYWSFEEPSDRCARLRKSVAKHLRSVGSFDLTGVPQFEADYCFDMTFGGRPTDAASRIISVLFALQDVARFKEITFASWSLRSGEPELLGAPYSNFWESLKLWVSSLGLSTSQEKWILHCALASPDWSKLANDGPWSDDYRARAVAEIWRFTSMLLKSEQGGWLEPSFLLRCRDKFCFEIEDSRSKFPLDFLPNAILLVEGPTEALLIPHFAKLMRKDLHKHGVMLVAAGGAKQVVKRYLALRDLIAIPIMCVFDKDACEQAEVVSDNMRDTDQITVFESGEIEDTFPLETFIVFLNKFLDSFQGSSRPLTVRDFSPGARKHVLSRLWKDRQLGSFDKIAFAESLVAHLHDPVDIPNEIAEIINKCTNATITTDD